MKIGVDMVEISRITKTVERHGQRFLQRVFTAAEIERYGQRPASLAGRWAGKEAVSKALGRGIGAVNWTDIEILSDERSAPTLHLHGPAATLAAELGLKTWAISLSHTDTLAIAFVVAQ